MIRAVFCLNGPDAVNGPNVWLTRHLPLLARLEIEPVVMYLSWHPDRSCGYRSKLEKEGMRVVSVALGRFVEDNAILIAEAAAGLEPDVFVPNYSIAGYYAAGFLRAAGIATVGTLHSDDPYYHDILDVFVSGKEQWRLSGVVGVSSYLRDLVRDRTGGTVPFLDAPYGAPIPDRTAQWSADRFRMVYAGRLVELQKRVRRVASSMLAATSICEKLEGVLYGVGEERSWLEDAVAHSKGRVWLGGLLSSDEMQGAMLQGQAFVLLSDFEGLSIALMEAMACGLVPIVSSMRSGVSDLVEDGVTGLVVDGEDPVAFAEAAALLANDRVLWNRLSRAARSAVIDRGYTTQACASGWAGFLERLTASRQANETLVIPPVSEWDLPDRSSRLNGMRSEDRRVAWPRMRMAMEMGRPLYLWGASLAGAAFLDSMGDRGLRIVGFIDVDPKKRGTLLRGLPIAEPSELERTLKRSPRPFVVITSQFEREISASLRELGLSEDEDFVAG